MAKKVIFSIVVTMVVISTLILITCALPSNPIDDPSNFEMKIAAKDTSTIYTGEKAVIGFHINIPKHLESIKVNFGDGKKDTTILYTNQSFTTADILYLECVYDSAGQKKINATAYLTNGSTKQAFGTVTVVASPITHGDQSIVFDTIPATDTVAINAVDSLRFIAHTAPVDTSINFTISSIPVITDTNKLNVRTIKKTLGAEAIVLFNPSDTGMYTIELQAQAGTLKQTRNVIVHAYKLPEFSEKPSDSAELAIGKSDTLVFTTKNEPDDSVRLEFRNQSDFKTGTIAVLPSHSDTLKIVFTPDEAKKYTFTIAATGKHLSNVIQVIRNVLSGANSFWKQSSITLNAMEGTVLQQNLAAFLTDSTITDVTYASSRGQISGRLLNYTIPYGKTTDTLNITASRTGKSPAQIALIMQITSGDSTKPTITIKSPSSDNYKSSTSQVTIEYTVTDDGAGVGSVAFSIGDSVLTDTTHTGTVYGCIIKGLVKGQLTTVTIVAKDASIRKNSSSASMKITYDPSITDTSGPAITFITKNGLSTSSSSPSIDLSCTDSSGVASVACLYGTHASTAIKNTDGTYTTNLSGLIVGENVIIFTATDASANANVTKDTIRIIYDPTMDDIDPPTVNLKNPSSTDYRVEIDSITVKIACHDDNGIGTVTATRAGQAITVSGPENDSIYSVALSKLIPGGSDTLLFTVPDKSTKANKKSFAVIIRYNRKPSPATLNTPAVNATGVALKPTFTWTDGIDPDGDSVTFTLKYGTTQTSLDQSKTGITAKQYTLVSDLANATDYYWQIVGKTSNGDSVASEIWKFTTVEAAPVITGDPISQKVILGNKATFSVTATGLNLKYQWQKGTSPIEGETTNTYTTSALTSIDDNSTYSCIVSNGGGSKTSASATLKIVYGITYNTNSGTGPVPSDTNHYAKGETVVAKEANNLSLTGSVFTGWYRTQNSAGAKVYAANDTLKMGSEPVTLYAIWEKAYSVIYNNNGGGIAGGHGSGTAPIDMKKYIQGSTVSVLANSEGLTCTGYVFDGWNTMANGKGTTYAPGTNTAKFTIDASDDTLYAKWVIKDASGNLYTEVKIGDQVWMVENLSTSKFNDGTDISLNSFAGSETKASFYPGIPVYGALYNGYAVAKDTNKLLAPPGWHVAIKEDWDKLITTAGNTAKPIASKEYWADTSINPEAIGYIPLNNNSTGFTAVPSDYDLSSNNGVVAVRGQETIFWIGGTIAFPDDFPAFGAFYGLNWDSGGILYKSMESVDQYHSVRCIRDY